MAVDVSSSQLGSAARSAWDILLAAASLAESLDRRGHDAHFGLRGSAELQPVASSDTGVVLAWSPDTGWQSHLPSQDARSELLNLYLPICSATSARPVTVGHLGQSLDGFIAMHSGESQFVTGDDNIIHLHRMRALCDAVVVGAGTVAADDPQLTVRHVEGPNPLRVIIDPGRRLAPTFRVFTDQVGPTLYFCSRTLVRPGESHLGSAAIVGVDSDEPGGGVGEVMRRLHARGCSRVFVEGGGVTVSAFLEADLLDRLQIAIAPVLIGDGRPAIRLAPHARLRDCRRPRYRVFRMGGDVMFDCELKGRPEGNDGTSPETPVVSRII